MWFSSIVHVIISPHSSDVRTISLMGGGGALFKTNFAEKKEMESKIIRRMTFLKKFLRVKVSSHRSFIYNFG